MKWSRTILMACAAAVVATGMVMFTGCEDDKDTDVANMGDYSSSSRTPATRPELIIDPANGEITHVGQQIQFKVDGGKTTYKWTVANGSAGTIVEQADDHYAVYTVTALIPNTITVRSSDGKSATASVSAPGTGALAILPSSRTLTSGLTNGVPIDLHGTTLNFTVTGGTPPYGNWSVSSPNLGTINAGTGVYTVDGTWGTGDNLVIISDSAGDTAQATVTTELGP